MLPKPIILIRWSMIPLLVFLSVGCQHYIKVESAPDEAQVYLVDGQRDIPLGKTPLDVSAHDSYRQAEGKIVFIKVAKLDYDPVYIAIDRSVQSANHFKVQLQQKDFGKSDILVSLIRHDGENINTLLEEVLSVQNLILMGNLSEAEKVIDELTKRHRKLAIVYLLKANFYLNKNEKDNAIRMYKKAQEFDPRGTYAQLMIDRLTQKNKR